MGKIRRMVNAVLVLGLFLGFSGYSLAKEPVYKKVIIPASELLGGEKLDFRGFEHPYGALLPQFSERRHCIKMVGQGGIIRGSFNWEDDLAEEKVFSEATFRIRGMWDGLKDVPLRATGYKSLSLEVKINGKTIFNGKVGVGTSRLWRFWPVVELEVPVSLLKKGNNIFEIINYTVTDQIEKSAFNISDVQILGKVNNKLDIITSPEVVHVGEPFLIEVLSKNDINKVGIEMPSSVKLLGKAKIKKGRNKLHFVANKEDANIRIKIKGGNLEADTIISRVIITPKGSKILLGHILNHANIRVEGENYSRWIHLFKETGQGNLVCFCGLPSKLAVDEIKASGLSVVVRPDSRIVQDEKVKKENFRRIKAFIKKLGKHFVGLGPHEFHGWMPYVIKEIDATKSKGDMSAYVNQLMERFRLTLRDMEKIDPTVPVWNTDPSFYARYYLMAGADLPGCEFWLDNFSAATASMRGTAKAFKKENWVSINSFECQAYGGLDARWHNLEYYDGDFEKRRINLWWLSQYMIYLAGSRTIYSESAFTDHHRVTIQKTFDDPHMVEWRKVQRELFNFTQLHNLRGQPKVNIAYVQGKYDLSKGAGYGGVPFNYFQHWYNDYTKLSWRTMEAAYPNLRGRAALNDNYDDFWNGEYLRREMFTDTPYGEVDILPIEAEHDVLSDYKMLVLTGWNTVDKAMYKKLTSYVKQGGTLFVLLPQLNTSTIAKMEEADYLNDGHFENLFGVTLSKEDNGIFLDIPLNKLTLTSNWENKFPHTKELLKKQPPTQIYRTAAYKTMAKGLRLQPQAEVIIREEFSSTPFLVKNNLGKGVTYLVNIGGLCDKNSKTLGRVINAALKDIFQQIPQDISLKSGKYLNFHIYEEKDKGAPFYKVFVISNDWFSDVVERDVEFSVFDMDVLVKVKRNKVSAFYATPDILLYPDDELLVVRSIKTSRDGTTSISLHGGGSCEILLKSTNPIREVELKSPDGDYKPKIKVKGDGLHISLNLSGPGTLVIRRRNRNEIGKEPRHEQISN